MTLQKHSLVNFLFLVGFPCYGIGSYLSFKVNFSVGVIFGIAPFLAILLFYAIDMMYRGRVVRIVNVNYGLAMLFLSATAAGYWIALRNGYMGLNPVNTASQSLAMLIPFNAAVVVQIYNRGNPDFNYATLLLKSLGLLMLINLLGFAAGMHNLVHGFAGRLSLPFMMGIYDGAHLLAVMNLMLIFYMSDFRNKPITTVAIYAAFMICLAMMANINSRLSIMIFFALMVLFLTRAVKAVKGLFTISIFTMPLLMSFSLLVYEVLTLPFFQAMLDRVSKEDVTTFNGRTYIWEGVWDWFLSDRRGLLFGNGYMGQAHIGMLDYMAKLWDGDPHLIHMHSTFLQVLVDQGLLVLLLLYVLTYRGHRHFRKEYMDGSQDAPMYAAMVYLMFIWQIDIFCYGMDIGNPILFSIFAVFCVKQQYITRQRRDLKGLPLA